MPLLAPLMLAAAIAAPEPVTIDLARLPHDTRVTVPAPAGATAFTPRLTNRIPHAEYTITIGNESTPVPALVVPANNLAPAPTPGQPDLAYTCRSLAMRPLARLCQPGGCPRDEATIADAVRRITASITACPESTQQLVKSTLAQFTEHTPNLTLDAAQRPTITITRTNPATTWHIQVTACDQTAQLERFLKQHHSSDAMKVLAYDVTTQLWTGYTWQPTGATLTPISDQRTFRRGITGQPRLALAPNEHLSVLITNINPVAYTARTTERTLTAIEDLASLQQMALLFGDVITAGLRISGFSDLPANITASITNTPVGAIRAYHITTTPAVTNENDRLATISKDVEAALEEYITPHAERIQALNKTAKTTLAKAQQITERMGALTHFVQRIEDRTSDLAIPADITALPATSAELETLLSTVAAQRNELRNNTPTCTGAIATAAELVQLRLREPEKQTDKIDALNRYLALLNDLDTPALKEQHCDTTLQSALDDLRTWLAEHPTSQALPTGARTPLVRIGHLLSTTNSLLAKREAAITAANDVLAKQPTLGKATRTLLTLADRTKPYLAQNEPCALAYGVIELPRPEGRKTTIPWAAVHTETVKLVPEAAFKDTVQLAHGETTAKYELARARRWEFDTDIAVTYTDLVDPEYGLVNGKVDRVKEKTRAGDLGMFLTMRRKDRIFGGQIGLSLAGYPGLFAGLAGQLGPWVKLSGGGTLQRVTTLAGNQEEGITPLASKEEIRTKDTFDEGFYLGLSITIDDLPFFKKN